MVGSSDDDHVAGQLIKLHQKERHYSLDLTSFVNVPAFLANGIKLIEEEDAWLCPNVVK
jgi:hypothetical protein